jgi:hypothetical protein
MARAALIALAILTIGGMAQADTCRQFFRQQSSYYYAAPVVAAQVVYPPAYYQAGQNLEQRAIVAKEVRAAVRDAVPGIVAELRAAMTQQAAQQSQVQKLAGLPPQSIMAKHCAKCHSGATPKAGLVFDGLTPVGCDAALDALQAMADGTMPKDHKLPDGAAAGIMEELLKLRSRPQISGGGNDLPPPPPTGDLQ